MDGPTHYRIAENIIASAVGDGGYADRIVVRDANAVAAAHVHATLALAAATALAEGNGMSDTDRFNWTLAAAVKVPGSGRTQ